MADQNPDAAQQDNGATDSAKKRANLALWLLVTTPNDALRLVADGGVEPIGNDRLAGGQRNDAPGRSSGLTKEQNQEEIEQRILSQITFQGSADKTLAAFSTQLRNAMAEPFDAGNGKKIAYQDAILAVQDLFDSMDTDSYPPGERCSLSTILTMLPE